MIGIARNGALPSVRRIPGLRKFGKHIGARIFSFAYVCLPSVFVLDLVPELTKVFNCAKTRSGIVQCLYNMN